MTDKELKSLIENVAADIGTLLKAETVAKVGEGEETEAEKTPDVSSTSPAEPSVSPEASSAPPPAEPSAAPPEAPPADASMAPPADAPPTPEASAPADPAAQGGEVDADALAQEYSQLPVEELKAHYLACKAALAGKLAQDGSAAPEGSAPQAPPMAPPGADAGGPPPMAMKSEKVDAEIEGLKKSLIDAQELIKRQESAMIDLTKAVTLAVKAPLQKAITFSDDIGTPAVKELTKDEVRRQLSTAAKRSDLKKSDRTLIDQWTVGSIGTDKIKHLLTGAA